MICSARVSARHLRALHIASIVVWIDELVLGIKFQVALNCGQDCKNAGNQDTSVNVTVRMKRIWCFLKLRRLSTLLTIRERCMVCLCMPTLILACFHIVWRWPTPVSARVSKVLRGDCLPKSWSGYEGRVLDLQRDPNFNRIFDSV